MIKTISPLAISLHAPLGERCLECVGVYSKAINLLADDGQLITLHRFGCGLSPMGWLLRRSDFYYVSHLLRQRRQIRQSTAGIDIDGSLLAYNSRLLNLSLPIGSINRPNVLLSFNVLQEVLSSVTAISGLYGPLNQIFQSPLDPQLLDPQLFNPQLFNPQLQTFLELGLDFLQGKEVVWDAFIGLGPGLTPSSDDALIGMLAVFFADPRISNLLQKKFSVLGNINHFKRLTTLVSYNYLDHASHGHFSTPLLYAISSLKQMKNVQAAINQLLAHGHTSGADTLLGMWLGMLAIYHYFSNNRAA